jgi:hypothetical protein
MEQGQPAAMEENTVHLERGAGSVFINGVTVAPADCSWTWAAYEQSVGTLSGASFGMQKVCL